LTPSDAARETAPLPSDDPRPFTAPWQAEAFALVVGLHQRGLFPWNEWTDRLSRELHKPGTAADGSDYYDCWLRALEALMVSRGIAAGDEIGRLQAAWQRAAEATPHGKPIALTNDPHHAGR